MFLQRTSSLPGLLCEIQGKKKCAHYQVSVCWCRSIFGTFASASAERGSVNGLMGKVTTLSHYDSPTLALTPSIYDIK